MPPKAKMLTMEEVHDLRIDSFVFCFSHPTINKMLYTLEAALKVVEAAKEVDAHYIHDREYKAIQYLAEALEPFRREGE